MSLFNRFLSRKNKKENKNREKQINIPSYLKSEKDLGLLENQIIYVEEDYNKMINQFIETYCDDHLFYQPHHKSSIEIIYMPTLSKQMQGEILETLMRYYFPNLATIYYRSLRPVELNTQFITRFLFSFLPFKEPVRPGLLRQLEKDEDGYFVYEYYQFEPGNRDKIAKQYFNYINAIRDSFNVAHIEEEVTHSQSLDSFFGPSEEPKPKPEKVNHKKRGIIWNRPMPSMLENIGQSTEDTASPEWEKIMNRVLCDITNLKEMGFYEILIKELGSLLFEEDKERMFQPSRLEIDRDYKIILPDFNNMEVTMTPLPKALFILFLRHPQGIMLKSLIDYKRELLEIYKLLSYRESFDEMVESINRICDPTEGSINEKLSRIKEAFLKKMSMDTATHYIVKGERGMEKRIEIDRSLINLPKVFDEIALTDRG